MAARLLSEEAREIAQLHRGVRDLVRDKKDDMNQQTREAVFEILLDGIREIEEVMVLPTVRGNLDPNLQNPAVDESSSWNSILLRLQNQINAVCILADLTHLGPAANNDETNALSHVKKSLRVIFNNISPVASLRGSSTDTD